MSDDKITVCDKCFQASCWHGIFMCDEAKQAGTIKKSRDELAKLGLENPCYWQTDDEILEEQCHS